MTLVTANPQSGMVACLTSTWCYWITNQRDKQIDNQFNHNMKEVTIVNFYSYGALVCGGRVTDPKTIEFMKLTFQMLDKMRLELVNNDQQSSLRQGTVLARTTFTNKVAFSAIVDGVRKYFGYKDGQYYVGHSMYESHYVIPVNVKFDYFEE